MEEKDLLDIKKVIKSEIINIELISETSNRVYKVTTLDKTLYAKFYQKKSSHIDLELKIYDIVNNKYLKEIYYKSPDYNMAIYNELLGKTVDELTKEELEYHKEKIIKTVKNFYSEISKYKVNGYGILNEKLEGTYDNFYKFLESRQRETSETLRDYKDLANIFDLIYSKYKEIIKEDNSLVPIDTNLKNIMILDNNDIKFCDPGEMISGPILMGYGDFAAHVYKTPLFDKLIEEMNFNVIELKLLRIYAIFSSLNILAFLKKLGIKDINNVIPYGNKFTFYELINDHLKELKLK